MLSIQPELLYVQKGATDDDEGVDVTLKLNYIEVPLLLKIKIPTEGNVSPYFLVGPAIGFKAGCKISGESDGASVDLDCDEDNIEFKSIDLGGVVGAGVGFPVGSGQAVLGARYNLGLIRVDDYDDDEPVKNRAFSFLAGYSFPVGG